MIIILDISIDDLNSIPSDECENLFTLLLDSDLNGRHFSLIDRDQCDWASNNLALSGQNSMHLVRLRGQYATRGGIQRDAVSVLKIIHGNSSVNIVGKQFEIGHLAFINGEYTSSTTKMVVENLKADGDLYQFILEAAKNKTIIPRINVEFVMGGGSTTNSVFLREIQKKRIVVCLVDTDRISPFDKLGTTARSVIRSHKNRNVEFQAGYLPYVGTALETIGHELENYIPLDAVKLLDAFGYPACLDSYIKQETAEDADDCFWLYFDIKEGIDGKLILDKGTKSDKVVEWISSKTDTSQENFSTIKIDKIGENISGHFLKSDDAKQFYKDFIETEYWKKLFSEHLECLLWFMATSPVDQRL